MKPESLTRYDVRREARARRHGRRLRGVRPRDASRRRAQDARGRRSPRTSTGSSTSSARWPTCTTRTWCGFGELRARTASWFFTMELVRGRDFIELRAAAARPRTLPTRARTSTRRALPADAHRPHRAGRSRGPRARRRRPAARSTRRACAPRSPSSPRRCRRSTTPGKSTATSSRRTCWSTREGRVVLLDFGLVAALRGARATRDDDRHRRHARVHGARAGRRRAASGRPPTGTRSA